MEKMKSCEQESTHDTSFTYATNQIFFIIWQETLQATTSTESGLKDDKFMHLLCEFHMHAYFPWQVINF